MSELTEIREVVTKLCEKFGEEYWRKLDATSSYPEEFVSELARAGFLGSLIPEEYGGVGAG